MTIAFARDLRYDLKPYMWDFFDVIIDILDENGENVDLLQSGFKTLAVFFKLQWRNIIKELRRTFMYFFI